MDQEQIKELTRLSESLPSGKPLFTDIDAFFSRLYGLKDHDLQVIRDTLTVALPYDSSRTRACALADRARKKCIRRGCEGNIDPFRA